MRHPEGRRLPGPLLLPVDFPYGTEVLFTPPKMEINLSFPHFPRTIDSELQSLVVRRMPHNLGVRAGGSRPARCREKYMKAKRHGATALRVSDSPRKYEVQQEIDSFLRAINSYPDRFAREPYLSFQQHLSSIVTTSHPPSADE